MFYVVV
jgi:hypothetical protein